MQDMARKPTIIGNWKMHGSKLQIDAFFNGLGEKLKKQPNLLKCEAAICPPFIYLAQAAKLLEQAPGIKLGAQDVSEFEQGAYTGQIGANMLKEQGCRYVIVGHSERRQYCHETDEEIANKFIAAKSAGLMPILCVGETQEQRQNKQTSSVVVDQLKVILTREGAGGFHHALIAYEPIWAIGTGLTATPEQAQQIHGLLRQTIAEYDATVAMGLPILYGGSVKPSNAQALLTMPDIDGALVGGASLEAEDFLAICEVASI